MQKLLSANSWNWFIIAQLEQLALKPNGRVTNKCKFIAPQSPFKNYYFASPLGSRMISSHSSFVGLEMTNEANVGIGGFQGLASIYCVLGS